MKKFLIVAHYSRFLVQFELNDVRLLQSMGFEVHYATNYQQEDMFSGAIKIIQENGVILHQIDFVRSPYNIPANIKAYRQLKDLMVKEKFSGAHCHTPMAGALARLAANATHTAPVIYTAHGFHFYKGCPLKNKLIYQTAETFLARYTDALVTINEEDFQAAKNFHVKGDVYKIPGVGIDTQAIKTYKCNPIQIRKDLGIDESSIVFCSVGEINDNKNHLTTIQAFVKANIEKSHYLLCGDGSKRADLENLVKELGVDDRVHFLGFQNNVLDYLYASDVFLFPSIREGLGLAALEAMATGLPVVAAENRGSKEYAQNSWVGVLCKATDVNAFATAMRKFGKSRKRYKENQMVANEFDKHKTEQIMQKVYDKTLAND